LTPAAEQETLMPIMPSPALSDGQAMVIEAIVTFNLIMVALGVTTPGKHSTLAALAIGCCKASGILAAVRLSRFIVT
jgi:glycerol uptake facilitator-like aquaporin